LRYPPEKAPDPIDELPNPELNPLLNPTLGRNLGRWAEVYFTSPPEKREEAVGELLRELKENPAPAATGTELAHGDLSSNETSASEESRTHPQSSQVLITTSPGVLCAECGHRHLGPQRFCGMCGAALATDALDHQEYAPQFLTGAQREPERVFQQTSIFGFDAPAPVSEPEIGSGADINWLREKNLAGTEASSGARKLIPAVLAMAAIGILIYAQSRPQKPQPRPATATVATPPVDSAPAHSPSQPTSPAPPASQASAPAPAPSTPAPAAANPAPNTNSPSENATATAAAKPALPPEKTAAPPPAPPASAANASTPKPQASALNPNAGAEDLALATDYLNGRRGPRDSAEAAKFLWKAVGKENPSAILLLSDMYLIGDGVPKSCDQARLLLNAAVRKNVPQAAQKLRNLQTAGCP
jgi:cell division septation protein DedD